MNLIDESRSKFSRSRLGALTISIAVTAALVAGGSAATVAAAAEPVAGPTTVAEPSTDTELPAEPVAELANDELAHEPQLFVEGTVSVLAIDDRLSSSYEYHVTTDDGETIEIAGDIGGDVATGSSFVGNVAISSEITTRVDARFDARIDDASATPIDADSSAGAEVIDLASEASVPLQIVTARIEAPLERTVAARAHTVNVAIVGTPSFSDADVNSFVAGLNAYWPSQSNGVISSVARTGAIARYSSSLDANCNFDGVWDEAAAKFGKTSLGYSQGHQGEHLVVISSANCGAGLGTVGNAVHDGGVIWANVNQDVDLQTIAHEFGHNLGLGHSNTHRCSRATLVEGTVADGCTDTAYADYYDVMGGGFTYCSSTCITTNKLTALNATHKKTLGFYSAGSLQTVTSSGTRVLNAASAASGLRALDVVDPLSGDHYLVEYRSGTGMDSGAFYTSGYGSMATGVRILKSRPAVAGAAAESVVLAPTLRPGRTSRVLALDAGQSLVTKTAGLTISVDAMSETSATIQVFAGALPATIDRISGGDRYATAVAVSQQGYPGTAPVVYIAQGGDYPDALSAAPAAVKKGGPLLLTPSGALPAIVRAELERLHPKKVVVVGGTGAVSDGVFNELRGLVPDTIRLGGADRYATSRLVVRNAFSPPYASTSTAYIATATNYPDALSASVAAGATGSPVVLVNGTAPTIDAQTETLLRDLRIATTKIAGGTSVVSTGIQDRLRTFTTVTRAAGADRFETSRLINDEVFPSATRVFLATGFQFPDALAGAALAGATRSPLYLVSSSCIPAPTRARILQSGASRVTVIGGAGVLTDEVMALRSC